MWYQVHVILFYVVLSTFGAHVDFLNQFRWDFAVPPFRTTQQNFNDILEIEYDFIVVGSGSSGAIIANRLSEVKSWNILLLEAGNPGNPLTQIPILAPLFQLTPYNWNYTMQKQEGVCLGMKEGICAWPRGRALGGSSVINYMIYTRGNPQDYNNWAQRGNEGWSYNEVLPYFLKMEQCHLDQCSTYHGRGGPISVEHPFTSPLTDAFLQAGEEIGEKIVDYNTPKYMGYSQVQATQFRGRRHSTADAYLYPILHSRPNLKIITSARVGRVLIDPTTKRTYGVEFEKRGRKYNVTVRKEVIMAAGALNSPQLLMLSGVGPQEHLEEIGIPLVKNLPVGEVLYDHIAYLGLAFTINKTVEPREALLDPHQIFRWVLEGKGVYTSLGGIEAIAYINTGSTPEPNYPDIELIFIGTGSLESDLGLVVAEEIRLKKSIYDTVYKPLEGKPAWSILPMLLHPKSRGYVKLQSGNPRDMPLFYGNYFTDLSDLNTLLAAIRYIQKLSKMPAFQRYNSTLHNIPIPGCELHEFDSDNYWICALRTLSSSLHHQVGTCKMGPTEANGAVVDPRLRVYGVEGLRVADSSIMPVTLSAHTSAPSMMIGEKASDLIKEDWDKL